MNEFILMDDDVTALPRRKERQNNGRRHSHSLEQPPRKVEIKCAKSYNLVLSFGTDGGADFCCYFSFDIIPFPFLRITPLFSWLAASYFINYDGVHF